MVHARHRTRSSWKSRVLGLVLLNVIPITGLAVLGWALATDRVDVRDLPEGLARNGALFGVVVVVLFLVASLILPLVHGGARALSRQLLESRARRAAGGAGTKFVEGLLWPFRRLVLLILQVLRLALFVLAFALIAAALLFLIRLFVADFGEQWAPIDRWIDDGLAWLKARF